MRGLNRSTVAAGAVTLIVLAFLGWIAAAPNAPVLGSKLPKGPTMEQRSFAQAYDLDDNEVVRFCPPPYPVQRNAMASWIRPGSPPQLSGEMLFHAGRPEHFWMGSTATATLQSSLAHVGELSPVEWDVSEDLKDLPMIGDWVMRKEAPRDQRMEALQSILRQVLNRPMVIERRRMLRPAVIVRGSYEFKSLRRGRKPKNLQLFVAVLDPQEGSGGGTGSFADVLERLEDVTGRRFFDETTAVPKTIEWSNNGDLNHHPFDRNRLLSLLANVTLQTGLKFELTEREIHVYCVREQAAAVMTAGAATRSAR